MQLQAGKILCSTAELADSYFSNTLILLTEYNSKGCIGLVFNRPYDKPLNALAEFSDCPGIPLYEGGPVDQEHLFIVHRNPEIMEDSIHIKDELYFGGNLYKLIPQLQSGELHSGLLKIFIGYCGWDAGELEAEIAEGSWTITDAEPSIVFSTNFDTV